MARLGSTSSNTDVQPSSEKGQTNGYAGLDALGLVPIAQLPSLPASVVISSADVPFTDGDTMRRVTVSDASVTAASKILGTIRRPNTADDSADRGYIYVANVVRVATGAFDLLVSCLGWGFSDTTELPPNETVKFFYQVAA